MVGWVGISLPRGDSGSPAGYCGSKGFVAGKSPVYGARSPRRMNSASRLCGCGKGLLEVPKVVGQIAGWRVNVGSVCVPFSESESESDGDA